MNCVLDLVILYTTKNIFQTIFFLYSLCPNQEGIKDALCFKFRRPMIGQNCSAVCTSIAKGGHRDAFRTNGAKRRTFREACERSENRHFCPRFDEIGRRL